MSKRTRGVRTIKGVRFEFSEQDATPWLKIFLSKEELRKRAKHNPFLAQSLACEAAFAARTESLDRVLKRGHGHLEGGVGDFFGAANAPEEGK